MNGVDRSSSSDRPSSVLPGRIDPHQIAVERGDAKQIQRQLEEAIEVVAGSLPLDEQADLAADRRHHRQQIRRGLADVAAEELQHALDAAPFHDRQGERGMEPDAFGRRGSRKVVVASDVGYPRRLAMLPDASRQADAARECRRQGGRGELIECESGGMPGPGAAHELSRPIDLPDGAALPAERVADRLDHARRRLFERRRLRQRARGFVENLLLAGQASAERGRMLVHEFLGVDRWQHYTTIAALRWALINPPPSRRILVVDDDRGLRLALSTLLKDAGHDVETRGRRPRGPRPPAGSPLRHRPAGHRSAEHERARRPGAGAGARDAAARDHDDRRRHTGNGARVGAPAGLPLPAQAVSPEHDRRRRQRRARGCGRALVRGRVGAAGMAGAGRPVHARNGRSHPVVRHAPRCASPRGRSRSGGRTRSGNC